MSFLESKHIQSFHNLCHINKTITVGMGKTIMLSSLIQTNLGEKPEEQVPATSDQVIRSKQLRLDATFRPMAKASFSQRSRATLIVAPASLIDQWASEISRSSRKGTVNVFVWHGSGRGDLGSMIDCDIDAIDVVITSYGTLSSEHSTMERTNNPLFQSRYSFIYTWEQMLIHCLSRMV